MTAAGLPSSGCAGGRDSQSMAFLSTPGKERLYSGVAKISASAALTRSRSVATAGGITSEADVVVVRRDRGQIRIDLNRHSHWRQFLGRVQQGGIEGGLPQAARNRQYLDCFVTHHWSLTRSPEMALAVLSRVAPLCADGSACSRRGDATSNPPHPRQWKNLTTNSAIQNKRHIESTHSFLEMSPIPRRNVVSWKTPRIVEIAVGMEINTYSCADL
jgi:coenzyme PQQ precursor peptide PqqA